MSADVYHVAYDSPFHPWFWITLAIVAVILAFAVWLFGFEHTKNEEKSVALFDRRAGVIAIAVCVGLLTFMILVLGFSAADYVAQKDAISSMFACHTLLAQDHPVYDFLCIASDRTMLLADLGDSNLAVIRP